MVKSSSKKSKDECHDYHYQSAESSSPSGCIGISMAAVLNAIGSSPLSPGGEGEDSSKSPFQRLKSVVQKTLNSPCRGQHKVYTHMSHDYDYDDDRELVYDKDDDLMQRATSYNTNGTEPTVDSSTKQNYISQVVKVQFHHPLITSVRLRLKTRSEDLEKLYFAPEELDEIECDRDETRHTDDIETMAVENRSYDKQGCIGRDMKEERKHRGVQILLREKSTR